MKQTDVFQPESLANGFRIVFTRRLSARAQLSRWKSDMKCTTNKEQDALFFSQELHNTAANELASFDIDIVLRHMASTGLIFDEVRSANGVCVSITNIRITA